MQKFLKRALSLLCLPLSWILHFLDFRIFGHKHFHAIGHLALELDAYVRECALGLQKAKYKMLLLAPTKRLFNKYPEHLVCNKAILDCWKEHYIIIRSPLLYCFFKLKCFRKLEYDISNFAMQYARPSALFKIYSYLQKKPLFSFADEKRGELVLQKMGIPGDRWFVCFHARSEAYRPTNCYHCRNSDVNALYLALVAIEQAGGYVIRVGAKNSPLLEERFQNLNSFIDYTKSPYLSDWMDVFLAKKSRFFLGGSSGLHCLYSSLNTPSVKVNCVPLGHLPHHPLDLAIPKLYYSKKAKRLLQFSEITKMDAVHYIHDSEFAKAEITLIDNSEEEIAEVVREMLARLEGSITYSREQKELRKKFASCFLPSNFCYGFTSNVGIGFLEKYRFLLECK